MKKHVMVLVTMVVALGAIPFAACTQKEVPGASQKREISFYTCPMHPQIHEEHSGECPICHMKLIPVSSDGGNNSSKASPVDGNSQPVIISPERQQMIGIKTAMATKKTAVKEIRTLGRVAFDPDLAVAQREYREIAQHVPSLKGAARSRLRLFGMSDEEIALLEKKGEFSSNLYLPETDDSVWVYATIYQDEMNMVIPGIKATIDLPSAMSESFEGEVRSIDPVLNSVTRSVRARIEVPQANGRLKPDTYVNVTLHIDLGVALTIPKSAVIDTGIRKTVFVVQEEKHFQSRDVKIGQEVGDDVVVLDGIVEGDSVITNGLFMVDSESRLKAAVSSPSLTPSCSEGQVWDASMSMCMPKRGS